MSEIPDFGNGFEDEFKPKLPRVSRETIAAAIGEGTADSGEIFHRMLAEQPALAERMAVFIAKNARDDLEAGNMNMVLTFTYHLLELQVGADELSASFELDTEE